ncbi:MAG: hypothetical protein M3O02_00860 [Acidobacteriota bacterium]|nr:hypothetical protein [Acidobacteriota bacterium]
MTANRRVVCGLLAGCALAGAMPGATAARGAAAEQRTRPAVVQPGAVRHPVLWRDPGRVAELDLFHGPGGKEGLPAPPFTFEAEDRSGSIPRFDAKDGTGRRWSVEVGRDARPEVAASRLLWAAGYLADDDYVIWKASVDGLRLRSGKKYLRRGYLYDARFARRVDGQTRLGVWQWKKNAFTGTRELNGLRVMLALLNCWDLKDENNPVVEDAASGSELFRVSGLGASFGKNGPRLFRAKAQDDVRTYARSGFITKRTETSVDFATPSRSYNPLALFSRRGGAIWIGRQVPRRDVKWIGGVLGQLSHKQIEDAFWAAGYSASEVNLFAGVVDARIRALGDL